MEDRGCKFRTLKWSLVLVTGIGLIGAFAGLFTSDAVQIVTSLFIFVFLLLGLYGTVRESYTLILTFLVFIVITGIVRFFFACFKEPTQFIGVAIHLVIAFVAFWYGVEIHKMDPAYIQTL